MARNKRLLSAWATEMAEMPNFGRNSAETVSVFKSPFGVSAERPYFGRNTFFWQKDLLSVERIAFV